MLQMVETMPVKLNNSMKFMAAIEEIVQKKKMTYIDAIVEYCEEYKMEPEVAGHLVGGKLKQQVQEEAEDLHLIKKTARLPI